MQMFLLIQNPGTNKARVRGVFPTAARAKNHDPEFKGMWSSGTRAGSFEINVGHLMGKHHLVSPILVNEELEPYAPTDAKDV